MVAKDKLESRKVQTKLQEIPLVPVFRTFPLSSEVFMT